MTQAHPLLPLVLVLAGAALAEKTIAATTDPVSAEQRYQLALEAQSARDYRGMMANLRQSAAAGDAEAQEMLGVVLLAGPTLYGRQVRGDRCEAAVWLRKAAITGSGTARQHLDLLNRSRHMAAGRDACDDH